MTDESILTDTERERILLEEELRHDFRMKQRGKYWWINSPIVIWLLSAVVAGFIPYSYSEYQRKAEIKKEDRQIRREAIADVRSEISFRMAQFKEVLERTEKARRDVALISDKALGSLFSNDMPTEAGRRLRVLFSSAPMLRVASELGGIYAIPRADDHASVSIGGTGWGNSRLPNGRGYRDNKYINDSLYSLWTKYASMIREDALLKGENENAKAAFEKLKDATTPNDAIKTLPTISSNELTMKMWSKETNLSGISDLRTKTVLWIEGVETAWTKVESLFADYR